MMLPKSHQLVMCGVIPTSNKTPVTAIKDLLINLGLKMYYKEFLDYGLDVQPFSNHASNISLACYVKIASSGKVAHLGLIHNNVVC